MSAEGERLGTGMNLKRDGGSLFAHFNHSIGVHGEMRLLIRGALKGGRDAAIWRPSPWQQLN